MTYRIADESSVQYDKSTNTYWLTYDWWRDQSLTTAIAMAVSAVTNTPLTKLDPINQVIDADALDNLFVPESDAELRNDGGRLDFQFHGCDTTIHSSGDIEIQPQNTDDERD